MKIFLVGLALVALVGFVYLNDYQHDMMIEGMEATPPPPDVDALAEKLEGLDTVFVLTTKESQQALYDAVAANPGATIHELGVTTEDYLHRIVVPSPDGETKQAVPALVMFTHEDRVWLDVSLRTDMPVYVLDYVRTHPDIDHVVLDPPPGIGEIVPETMVLDLREVSALYWSLRE